MRKSKKTQYDFDRKLEDSYEGIQVVNSWSRCLSYASITIVMPFQEVPRSSKQHDPKLTKIMSIINQQRVRTRHSRTSMNHLCMDFVRIVLLLIVAVRVVSSAQHDILILILIFSSTCLKFYFCSVLYINMCPLPD